MVHNNPMKVGSLTDSAPQHAQVQTQIHRMPWRLGLVKLSSVKLGQLVNRPFQRLTLLPEVAPKVATLFKSSEEGLDIQSFGPQAFL